MMRQSKATSGMSGEKMRRILLGEITGAHGVRGDVVVRSYTATPEAIGTYGPLTDANGAAALSLRVVRVTPKGAVIARVKGVTDRNGAEALKGRKLHVAREAMPDPDDDDDFYVEDLIGLIAVNTEGKTLGEVIAVENFGAGDLLEVRLTDTRKSELLPFTKAVVPDVDLQSGRVTVVMPDTIDGEPRDTTKRETDS